MANGDHVPLPRGYWGPEQARPILDKVLTTRYEVDLDELGPGERAAVRELVAAGQRWSTWDERHEHIAARVVAAEKHRTLFARFAVLEEG